MPPESGPPVGKAGKGTLARTRPDDLAVAVIQNLLKNTPELDPQLIDDVLVGCANPEGEQGLQIGRLIAKGHRENHATRSRAPA